MLHECFLLCIDACNVGGRMGISSALLLLIFILDLNTRIIYSTIILSRRHSEPRQNINRFVLLAVQHIWLMASFLRVSGYEVSFTDLRNIQTTEQ